MAYQVLEGIKITPKGSYNASRFRHQFQGGTWPNSFAFGGWIYSATTSIGFSSQPNEIKVDVVLETKDRSQQYAAYDIRPEDLKCDAGEGNDENLFDIDFNGVKFTDYVLYSYETSIENNAKILSVTFKDYSVILDKIYVGLLKRQGNKFVYTATSNIEFPVNCTDCMLDGSSFWANGSTTRDLSYGSYVGINGQVYDNFTNISLGGNIYKQWEKLFNAPQINPSFDLNGGYLILGTEQATEERCGNLAEITYSFNQLLASLRRRGFKFEGAFPKAISDGDYAYKQNYVGTLREVLQNWCSDLGYDFYCDGKRFIGINLNKALDISPIASITDPTSQLGQEFAVNKESAIISFKEVNSLDNTYRQSVVTANNRPRESKSHTKSPKRYIGYLPMHPLDFNFPRSKQVTRTDVFGNLYNDTALVNSFLPNSFDATSRRAEILDNRTFGDIDTAMALGHYSDVLRDIYCQDRALYSTNTVDFEANFRALGIIPLVEITEAEEKSFAIEEAFPESDEVSNLCRDQRYYRVFIGYYYSKFKDDITEWEQISADMMYKFGAVKKGIMQKSPYVPYEVLQDANPASGLSGVNGARITRITHNFEPSAKQQFDLYNAPFKDLLLYSGTRNFNDYYPLELWVGDLSNEWGTTKEEFDRTLSLGVGDACFSEFQQEPNYVDTSEGMQKRFQDWRLDMFRVRTLDKISNFFEDYEGYFLKLSGQGILDRVVDRYYSIQYKEDETCSKLHLIVVPDVRTHPNIKVSFNKRGRDYINPVVLHKYLEQQKENADRKRHQKTRNICEKPLLQELCEGLISGRHVLNTGDNRYGCALEDEYNTFEEGFTAAQLSVKNSRGLEVSIVKNPIGNNDNGIRDMYQISDTNGDFYYADLVEDFLTQKEQQANLTIIYPISFEPSEDQYYRGILTSTVEIENRSPEITEILGEPVNTKRNNAAGIKIINNSVDSDLQPQLDPYSDKFVSYLTVLTGDGQVLTTVSGYHNFVKNLNNYQTTGITKTVELSLAGTPKSFSGIAQYLNPNYGLTRLSLSVNDNGVRTDLSFSDKPPVLPKQEAILNKIGPRIK